jgi:hypothetical protein
MRDLPPQHGPAEALATTIRADGSTEVNASPLRDGAVAARPSGGDDLVIRVVSNQGVHVRA